MKKRMFILLSLVSLSLTLGLMSNTYSRYVADTTSNLEVLFAKWQILVNENDITTGSTSSINLVPVIEENSNVEANMVAPSSKGYFDIDIDPSNVGVAFNYSITLEMLNENMPDLMITKYAIINSDYVEGDEITTTNLVNNSIEGTVELVNKNEPFTIRIYFEWYEGENELMNDEQDTEVAQNNTSFQIKTNIHFEQKI